MSSARSSRALLSVALCAGCTASAASFTSAATAEPARAGNLPSTSAPDRDAAAIAALRAKGAEGLRQVLREYDAATPAARAALGATVDAVAAQRYATVSRLYWYTELEAAKLEARRSGRPILALRMLGRLDEDLSCANSRFFRTALYSNRQIADLLRDQFVLLWTSEREVPRVTIDFGDGRTMVGTVTGNSIHYVLDADGHVIDALPGLYIPSVFAAELASAREVVLAASAVTPEAAAQRLAQHLQDRRREISSAFGKAAGAVWEPAQRRLWAVGEPGSAVAVAQRATVSKLAVEVPLLAVIASGTDPGTIEEGDIAQWATIGQAMFGIGEVHPRLQPADRRRARVARAGQPSAEQRRNELLAAPTVIDAQARSLVAAVFAAGELPPESAGDPVAVLARFQQRMVADTALNQVRLRQPILATLAAHPGMSMDDLNRWVYAEVFATPRSDAWLGLMPRDEYTGLPGDGVVMR